MTLTLIQIMTKQEAKQEAKEKDGNPEIKNRIRTIQRQMAQKRMMNDVKKADVIVTNPTHISVALKYDGNEPYLKYYKKDTSLHIEDKGKRVFWILPNEESKPLIVHQVREVAVQFNDVVLPTTRWQKDKIHPSWAGYKELAERTK